MMSCQSHHRIHGRCAAVVGVVHCVGISAVVLTAQNDVSVNSISTSTVAPVPVARFLMTIPLAVPAGMISGFWFGSWIHSQLGAEPPPAGGVWTARIRRGNRRTPSVPFTVGIVM